MFYSNCLIQALKQKLLYPTTKIYFVKPSRKGGWPHFVWSWQGYDGVYHFTFAKKKKPRQLLWFKGTIEEFPANFLKKVKLIRVL